MGWGQIVSIFFTRVGVRLDVLIWTSYGKANLWKELMTQSEEISWDDTVLPFQLDASDIRGRVARLDGLLDQVLAQHLGVMDASAIALARDNNLPIIVFSLDEPGGFKGILAGQGTYTTVRG